VYGYDDKWHVADMFIDQSKRRIRDLSVAIYNVYKRVQAGCLKNRK